MTAGVAGGCGVRATHFIAILAYRPGIPVTYDALLTSLSLLLSIISMALGLGVGATWRSRWRALLSGAIIGGGAGLMHYVGMSALLLPGRIEWSAELVAASLIWGFCLSSAAVWVAGRGATIRHLLWSALLLTLAIGGLHFTAMTAVRIVVDPTIGIHGLAIHPARSPLGSPPQRSPYLRLALSAP